MKSLTNSKGERIETESFVVENGCLSIKEGVKGFEALNTLKSLHTKIRKVVGSKSLESLESPLTSFCNLEEADFSQSLLLRIIPKKCFCWLKNLKSVKLPNSITVIESQAFSKSTLREFSIESESDLIIKSNCFEWTLIKSLSISAPNRTVSLHDDVFCYCKSLKSVKITAKTVIMASACFLNCTTLREVELDCKMECLKSRVFSGCQSLRELKVPDGVKWIGDLAFSNCKALRYLELPNSLERITDVNALEFVHDSSIVKFLDVGWSIEEFRSLVAGHLAEDNLNANRKNNLVSILMQVFSYDETIKSELQKQTRTLREFIRGVYPEEFAVKDGYDCEEPEETSLF